MPSVVGDQDCPITKIVAVLVASTSFSLFASNWSNFARRLVTPEVTILKIRSDLLHDKITFGDALHELILNWVGMNGKRATLHKLIGAFEVTGMKSFGELLRETFKLKTTFCQCPKNILKFIKFSSTNVLIISTFDVKITSDKIVETVNDCEVYTVEEFIYSRSSYFDGDNCEVKVVVDCDREQVNIVLQELSQNHFNNKFILISPESDSVLQNLLKGVSLDGLIETQTDYMEWDDLNATTRSRILLKLQIHFQIELEREEIKNVLRDKVLIDLLNGTTPVIFKETLPEQLSYYVQRQLLTRNILSEKIFENTTDIFLFNGVERFELSRLAQGQLTRSSTEQLRQRTVRFITLDQSTHFAKICENEKSSKNIHWIKKDDDGRLRWIKSKGNISCVQKCVDKLQERLDEDKFLDYIINNNAPICITDSPGMGKTVILAQFGRRLRSAYPNRIILFVELTEFVKQVKASKTNDKIKSILVALETLTCQNELGRVFLKTKINSSENGILIELLLDGLDEVNSEDSELAYEILTTINNSFQSVRLWVSSRPHLLLQPVYAQMDNIHFNHDGRNHFVHPKVGG